MKGISAIIAVVLILMITVALAAMAYVWFTGVFGQITTGASGQINTATSQIGTDFQIMSATYRNTTTWWAVSVYATNTGSTNITLANVGVYVNDTLRTPTVITGGTGGILATGQIATFVYNVTAADSTLGCGKGVKVTYGSIVETTATTC